MNKKVSDRNREMEIAVKKSFKCLKRSFADYRKCGKENSLSVTGERERT
jgi:hypothetical protein